MLLKPELIDVFIEEKKLAWSPTTQRSERYRLTSIIDFLDGNPHTLWDGIQNQKPYSRVTTWTRATTFWDWLLKKGHVDAGKSNGVNPYREFRSENARSFKNCYVPKLSDLTVEEAKERIARIDDPEVRAKAIDLLLTGCRWNDRVDEASDKVVGKGGRTRHLFGKVSAGNGFDRSYQTFWRKLNQVGLKPHDLRKIAASVLAKHLGSSELMRIFGWSDYRTSQSYIMLSKDEALSAKVQKLLK